MQRNTCSWLINSGPALERSGQCCLTVWETQGSGCRGAKLPGTWLARAATVGVCWWCQTVRSTRSDQLPGLPGQALHWGGDISLYPSSPSCWRGTRAACSSTQLCRARGSLGKKGRVDGRVAPLHSTAATPTPHHTTPSSWQTGSSGQGQRQTDRQSAA